MEREHVVIDLERFLCLKDKAAELARLKNDCFVLPKDTFTLGKDYRDRLHLEIDAKTAEGIAEVLFKGSEFTSDYVETFKSSGNYPYDIGEYYIEFRKKDDIESEEESI